MTRRRLAAERSVEWLAENRNGADAIACIMHLPRTPRLKRCRRTYPYRNRLESTAGLLASGSLRVAGLPGVSPVALDERRARRIQLRGQLRLPGVAPVTGFPIIPAFAMKAGNRSDAIRHNCLRSCQHENTTCCNFIKISIVFQQLAENPASPAQPPPCCARPVASLPSGGS